MTYKKSSKDFLIKILKSPMNKWPPNKGNFMSQFLCFFDTTILCQQQLCPIFHTVHHTTDHLLTRLLFPYVECPYLWIWSMTFFGGKELLRKAKKFSAAVTIVISFRILVLMLTLVIALLNTQGFRYEGVKGVGYYTLLKYEVYAWWNDQVKHLIKQKSHLRWR